MINNLVILANGEFPFHNIPLQKLKNASAVVCCDGSAIELTRQGYTPHSIVGDLDSITEELKEKYKSIILHDPDQEINDLTKAVKYSLTLNPQKITILGATGKREDHTLGNISLLAGYSTDTDIPIEIVTNYGKFCVVFKSTTFACKPGEHVSFFSLSNTLRVESTGLKYPLENVVFDSWWKATLNECEGSAYRLILSEKSPLIVYTAFDRS